ncbi:hypothetical protein Pcinc_037052, partial [Petrolisthes cinctipes]
MGRGREGQDGVKLGGRGRIMTAWDGVGRNGRD